MNTRYLMECHRAELKGAMSAWGQYPHVAKHHQRAAQQHVQRLRLLGVTDEKIIRNSRRAHDEVHGRTR